ncbi:MAG: hypothetical protein H0W89_00930 [Candidatus Levybacteria bacterium]|nr:hypothetical protein [Candidatus Levybacteria bacterium]
MPLNPERLWVPNKKQLWTPEGTPTKDSDPRSKRAYLFIAGGLAANHGLVGIENAFHEITGSPYVKVMNSLISMDEPDPKRHEHQAIFIKEQLEAGREVEIVTHSLGSLESTRAINLILDENPHYFDDPDVAKRLTLNYTASSGFDRGPVHETKFIANYLALGGPKNRALNVATAFTPQNMSVAEVTDAMRFVFGGEKPDEMLPFADRDRNYDKLSEELKEKVEPIDEGIKAAKEAGKQKEAYTLFSRRGKLLGGQMQDVLDGRYVDGDKLPEAPAVNFVTLAKQPEVRSSLREMLTKSVYTTTHTLLEKGVNLKVVGMEHDTAISRSSMQYFIDQTATPDNRGEISFVEAMGHIGPTLQARYYVDAVTRKKGEEYPVL